MFTWINLTTLFSISPTCMLCIALASTGQAQVAGDTSDELVAKSFVEQLKASQRDHQQQLVAVRATGRLTAWEQRRGELQPEAAVEADVSILYSNPCYLIQVSHFAMEGALGVPARQPPRQEMVLYDGDHVSSLVLEGDHARGDLYFDFSQDSVLRSAGFPFASLVHLSQEAIIPTELDPQRLSIVQLNDGGTVATENRGNFLRRIYLFGDFDYDIRRVALFHPQSNSPFREYLLSWDAVGEVHFVRRLSVRHRYKVSDIEMGEVVAKQQTLEFDTFELCEKIGSDQFHLSRLRIPQGTFFADHRRNVNGKAKVLQWNGSSLVDPP